MREFGVDLPASGAGLGGGAAAATEDKLESSELCKMGRSHVRRGCP